MFKLVMATFLAILGLIIPSTANAANIAVIDESNLATKTEIVRTIKAVNIQLAQIEPVWGVHHRLHLRAKRPKTWWKIVIRDDSDVFGALGYHGVDKIPVGFIFVRTAEESNFVSWTTVLSHETLEMAVNPRLKNRFYDSILNAIVDRELSDGVQGDEFLLNGVKVSDWVFPSWFTRGAVCPCDYLNLTHAPFELRPDGYMPIFDPQEKIDVFKAPRSR